MAKTPIFVTITSRRSAVDLEQILTLPTFLIAQLGLIRDVVSDIITSVAAVGRSSSKNSTMLARASFLKSVFCVLVHRYPVERLQYIQQH